MGDEQPGLQARIEASVRGRAAISGLIILVLCAVALANLISLNVFTGDTSARVNRGLRVVGLHQHWSMFAPPPRNSTSMDVDLTYPDGTVRRWHWPGKRTGQYRAYHWGKVEEAIIVRRNGTVLRGFAAWIVQEDRHDTGMRPVKVQLHERWGLLGPPGPGPSIVHEHEHILEPINPAPRPGKGGETV